MNILIIQTVLIVLLGIIILNLILYNKSLKLEKRISKYCVDSIKQDKTSLFDILHDFYFNMVYKLSKILKRSSFLVK